MLGEVEVGHDEPHKDDDGTETKQVEGDLLEEGHVKHVCEDADAIVVPILEHKDKSDSLSTVLYKITRWYGFLAEPDIRKSV